MSNHGAILLVSDNPELHQVLEIIASTYGFSFLGAENAKKGFGLLKSTKLDCMIFDLEIFGNYRKRTLAKKKLGGTGIPTLVLNDHNNGDQYRADLRSPVKIEPIAKFLMDHRDRLSRASSGGFLRRLLRFRNSG